MDYFRSTLELKTVDVSQRIISGYAAAWSLDRVGDVIAPSAFTKTLSEKTPSDIAVFIGHESQQLPVGIPILIKADSHGLYTETKVFEGPAGDNLLHVAAGLQAHGQSLGLSIGYRVYPGGAESGRVSGKMVRKLTSIDLKEYSFAARQTIANPDALATGVKTQSEIDEEIESAETKSAIGSFAWISGKVQAALREDTGRSCYIVEIFPSKAIFRCYGMDAEGNDEQLYQTAYSVAGDTVTVGTASPVDVQYVPMPASSKTSEEAPAMKTGADAVNDLPDSAFLYVETGEHDEAGKTVPRSKRHFPFKNAEGVVDVDGLKTAIRTIPETKAPGCNPDTLGARARRLLEQSQGSGMKTLDVNAPEWTDGAALDLSAVGYKVLGLAEDLANEQAAMRLLGEDTKAGKRIRAETRAKISDAIKQLEHLVRWAEMADAGAEKKAVVDRHARELELLSI